MLPFCLRKTITQPRLYQQACRLASTRRRVLRPKTAPQPQPAVAERSKGPKNDDEEVVIRWYEKDMATGETRRVAGNPEEMEAMEMRKKIKALEDELRQYKDDDEIDESMLAALKPHERVKVEAALAKRRAKETAVTDGLELSLALPRTSVPLLKRLNEALRNAALKPNTDQYRKELWRWYGRAKANIPALPRMVTPRAWEVLWQTQSTPTVTNPEHVCQILGDMQSVGQPLSDQQKHIYIESLLNIGDKEQALERWHDDYVPDGPNSRHHLQLGIDVFIQTENLDRAHELLEQYLSQHPDQDPGPILNLIAANALVGNDHMAFAMYLVLRSYLYDNMTIEQYDMVAIAFLNCGKKDLALAVFRDMMLRGKNALRRDDFNHEAKKALYDNILSRAVNHEEINHFSLTALSVMPHEWHNKFFYGKWLKRLLALRQLDAATKVIEMMYEREINPDTKHMNGLIAAFLRSTDEKLQQRGLEIGLSMIQVRLDFTYERRARRRQGLEEQPPTIQDDDWMMTGFIDRRVPRASLETFNVMAQHAVLTKKFNLVRFLRTKLNGAEYSMDTFFMNQLLQMTLYSVGPEEMWQTMLKHTAKSRPPPDMETYRILWAAETAHMDKKRTADRSGFPLARSLFRVMVTWLENLDEKGRVKARESFDQGVYVSVLQSFCIDQDIVGALVAVHAVAKYLGHYPVGALGNIITTACANLDLNKERLPTIRTRRGTWQISASQAKVKNVTSVFKAVSDRRAAAAKKRGIKIQNLEIDKRAREGINMLSEFVRVMLVKTADPETVESMIQEAAREMGVGGIRTGDVDASNVDASNVDASNVDASNVE